MKNDPRSCERNLCNCVRSLKKIQGFNGPGCEPATNISSFIAQLVRASHLYREVTGSNHVEVLNFFSGFLCNCINCVHNAEDHSSFDFISAVLILDLFHKRL